MIENACREEPIIRYQSTYMIPGDKSEKNKAKETAPVIDEGSSTTTIATSPKKPRDIDESEFRNSLYEIDQCIFIKDSSSDDDDVSVVPENDASDLASQLSREEKISQEEILRLIKEQNARRNRASPPPSAAPSALPEEPHTSRTGLTDRRPSSSRVQNEKPFSNLSDVEDDPEILGESDSDVVEDSQEMLKASQTRKPQQLNTDNIEVQRPSELLEKAGVLEPDLTPPDSGRASPDVIQDSGISDSAADELVESPLLLDDSQQLDKTCQSEELIADANASGYTKSMSMLDKMISSVTGGSNSVELAGCSKATVDAEADTRSVELFSDSESDDDMIEVTEAGNEESPYFEELKSQNLEIVIDPNRVCQDDLFSDVFQPVKEETSEVKENSEIKVRSNVTPKADETKKSAVVEKEDKRFKKLAEIFQKVVTDRCISSYSWFQ